MVQLKSVDGLHVDRLFPLLGRPVAAGSKQAVQNAQENGPFDGKLEFPSRNQPVDYLTAARLLPEPLEDHSRSDRPGTHFGRLAASIRGQQQDRFAKLCPTAEQTFQLAALLDFVQSAQRGDNALLRASVFPAVLDDLQVNALCGLLLAKEQGDLLSKSP